MAYIDEILVFESDKVYYTDDLGTEFQVMMTWEDSIMKASADMDKTKTSEANQMLKENIATAREAMKDNNTTRREAMKSQSQERIARTNARSRSNGKTSN